MLAISNLDFEPLFKNTTVFVKNSHRSNLNILLAFANNTNCNQQTYR